MNKEFRILVSIFVVIGFVILLAVACAPAFSPPNAPFPVTGVATTPTSQIPSDRIEFLRMTNDENSCDPPITLAANTNRPVYIAWTEVNIRSDIPIPISLSILNSSKTPIFQEMDQVLDNKKTRNCRAHPVGLRLDPDTYQIQLLVGSASSPYTADWVAPVSTPVP